ncbi:DNA polymerase III subunit epsilon [Candidatus Falkowbacteria bacterium CG_4_9_14_3_um_filter_36_9]|uniref:DNA polymerase III subunit epsilon n=1 Tax=Candidatus Falkowbacteria bacterium CG02_land_8_20_14_3_00_36_14 TaxID=1974560 RepID=A0A2M7DLD0_9BACT|nr:MAG: DNA polymerase III subunit epsilon [Candidatus Falkowbacteria bacterium CG02_land_8_20_14_3_00_36_14]PIX12261.1 MAG: DNA polymerase III subunit epsilon [Candidatus Falkowbacteria bacterium CG_4_8_14_3_um_filter_36_11]PJA10900.1 MAG: DNA polymerase III subunit epsilon [Candidatus Falkowbacteria bacterium CG_4_10_14_0_2_um_filter_36_22]PJB18877.1 MAG: DNA polymerase III subunit epsilon [Candidatus Falkowbacteria bacterium CG_4_9_14_3_um_filter_36_9]
MLIMSYLLKIKKFNINPEKINNLIELDKPLIIFNLETTGLEISKDKIIEIAYVKIWPNGKIKKGDILLNPEIKISKEITEINGIKNKDLSDKPKFMDLAQELWEIFNNSCYGGYNIIDFYLPLLRREFIRVGMDFDYTTAKIFDSKIIYHYMEPPILSAAYKFYCQKEYADDHKAILDVQAAIKILEKQLKIYKEVRDWEFIKKINSDDRNIKLLDIRRKIIWNNGDAYFSFSKYKNMPLIKVAKTDPKFLKWILKSNFPDRIKHLVKKALQDAK